MITPRLKEIFNKAAKTNEKFVREAIRGIGPKENYNIKTVNNNTVNNNNKYKRV